MRYKERGVNGIGAGRWRGRREDYIRFKDGKSKKFQGTLWRPVLGEILVKEAEVATS